MSEQGLKSGPGTYALVLHSPKSATAQIGRWGRLDIQPGWYVYVGSAFGPGGVRARVLRHCREKKSKHWHVDYLREHASLVRVWYSHEPAHSEHLWAQALTAMKGASPVKGFGCTDCRCRAHLFVFARKPPLTRFRSTLGARVKSWEPRPTGVGGTPPAGRR